MEQETLIISPPVPTELDHLPRRDLGFAAAVSITDALLNRAIEGRYRLAELKHRTLTPEFRSFRIFPTDR
ncbi:hypothetical protein AB0H71_20215 [Nocardia sp. NPDC050697]|uniref:hypothetical protein n=1 Tax=Nocardia sp. NPDC050697 TaxID=3155158 RepID=UPI0033DE8635